MSNPLAQTRPRRKQGEDAVWNVLQLWCPGCDTLHEVYLVGPDGHRPSPCWEWDGSLDAPTVSPSILTRWYGYPRGIEPKAGEKQPVGEQACHAFLRSGRWQFLGDSTHALAGQTVDMVPLPDWLVAEG